MIYFDTLGIMFISLVEYGVQAPQEELSWLCRYCDINCTFL